MVSVVKFRWISLEADGRKKGGLCDGQPLIGLSKAPSPLIKGSMFTWHTGLPLTTYCLGTPWLDLALCILFLFITKMLFHQCSGQWARAATTGCPGFSFRVHLGWRTL